MGESRRRGGWRSTATGPPPSYQRSFRCQRASAARGRTGRPSWDDRVAGQERFDAYADLHRELEERLDAPMRRMWACGAALALTVGGLSAGAAHLARLLLDARVPVFVDPAVPAGYAAAAYGVCAAAVTLQGTALLHVLTGSTRRPARAFAWIGAFTVPLVALLPFVVRAPLPDVVATALLNLAGGAFAVAGLTMMAAVFRTGPRWTPWSEPSAHPWSRWWRGLWRGWRPRGFRR